uniref:Uncharacterized protein n=1 Tax=Poecilia reticulata TaxID=8081 RepID=A0A3P9Q401_POERE
MGLTKQYLRYAASAVFGVIGSQRANIAYVTLRGGEKGRYVAVAACEHVFIWDVRKGEKVCGCNVTTCEEVHKERRTFSSHSNRFCLACASRSNSGSR